MSRGTTLVDDIRARASGRASSRRVVVSVAAAVVAVSFTVLSIFLRRRVPSPLGLSPYDGLLFARQANELLGHQWLGGYNNLTLVKVPGFSLFMAAVNDLGIRLKDAEQAVVILSALVTGLAVQVVVRRLWVALFVYCAVVLDPVFLGGGTADFSREGLFASLLLVMVSSFFVAGHLVATHRAWLSVPAALLGGLSTAGLFLVREESLSVMPTAAIALAGPWLVRLVQRWRRSAGFGRVPRSLLVAGPTVVAAGLAFLAPLMLVENRNQDVYGADVLSETTGGPFLPAYATWQRVEAGDVVRHVPITEQQREAVYEISSAAASLEPYLEDPTNKWRFAGECGQPGPCDFEGGWMTWALRDAAASAGEFESAARAAAFWTRLEDEIEAACADGRLECRLALPASLQPVQRISAGSYASSFARISWSLLTSRGIVAQLQAPAQIPIEQRVEFAAADLGVPESAVESEQQFTRFLRYEPTISMLARVYEVGVLIGVVLVLVCAGGIVARPEFRARVGMLTVLAAALLTGILSRIAVLALVDAADYDADQPRYQFPGHVLLVAFLVVALAEIGRILIGACRARAADKAESGVISAAALPVPDPPSAQPKSPDMEMRKNG